MFKLCLIAMIGVAAAGTCETTSCTYTDGHTHVFSKMLNDDGTANALHERWHCEKSTTGCDCTCEASLKCTVNHHHTSGYTRSFDHCEATPSSCATTYSPVVSLDSACDYDATSNTWTSIGSASGITMDTSGMVLDSAMGPLFNEGRGRQIDYNVSPSNHEALTYEIWFYVVEKPTRSQCWILGHDNGGYDRSLNLCDSRYGGIGAGNGGTWRSSLGYVEENAWYHIVVTFQNGKTDNKVYVQKVDGALASNSFSANNGDGDQHFSIGGLENYANHHIKAYIPIVRLYDTRLDQTQVEALFDQDKSRFGSR